MRSRYSVAIQEAETKISNLNDSDSDIEQTVKKATRIMSKMGDLYNTSSVEGKQSLLGSIFPEMLEFDGKRCRTTKINEAVTLCLSIDKGFRGTEKWKLPKNLEVSTLVGVSGFEPPISRPPDAHFNRTKLHPAL